MGGDEPQKLADLVPVDVLTEVNTAIAVLETQGPAITEALQQLDLPSTQPSAEVAADGS